MLKDSRRGEGCLVFLPVLTLVFYCGCVSRSLILPQEVMPWVSCFPTLQFLAEGALNELNLPGSMGGRVLADIMADKGVESFHSVVTYVENQVQAGVLSHPLLQSPLSLLCGVFCGARACRWRPCPATQIQTQHPL